MRNQWSVLINRMTWSDLYFNRIFLSAFLGIECRESRIETDYLGHYWNHQDRVDTDLDKNNRSLEKLSNSRHIWKEFPSNNELDIGLREKYGLKSVTLKILITERIEWLLPEIDKIARQVGLWRRIWSSILVIVSLRCTLNI